MTVNIEFAGDYTPALINPKPYRARNDDVTGKGIKAGRTSRVSPQIVWRFQAWESMATLCTVSADGKLLRVEPAVWERIPLLREAARCAESDEVIPLPQVNFDEIAKVVRYVDFHNRHKARCNSERIEAAEWDERLVDLNCENTARLLRAADYLGVTDLITVLCKKISGTIRNMSVSDIRVHFKLSDKFLVEEL